MRIFMVMSEANFYQPQFVADFLMRTSDEIVGAALVTRTPPKGNIELYLIKHFYYLRPLEIVKLVFEKVKAIFLDKVLKKTKEGHFYSVRSVFEVFGIDYFEVENNINKERYLKKIRKTRPEVILSSNSLYFNREVLKIPTKCSINRHSALLPSYGGLWPVFQAVRSGEKYTGASAHIMISKIDEGRVLAQKKIKIKRGQTIAQLYDFTFKASVDVVLEALEKVRKRSLVPIRVKNLPSYFSFPVDSHWKEFRKRGGKFI